MTLRHLPAALIALAATAHAALIYSGVQNVPIPQTIGGVYVRLSDSTVSGSYPLNWDTEPWLNPFFGGVDVGNSDLLRPIITGADRIVNLAPGTLIDATGNFVAGESGSTTHTGPAADQFQIGTPGIMGFKFETSVGGPDFYGWLRMSVNNGGAGAIVDWAYNDIAGASIQAGAVPEPATLLVGVALCGLAVLRRRRAA